jgi:mRNA interferase YafQ
MNLKIQLENSFEKDLKKIKRRGKDLSKLKAIAEFLEAEIPLPERFRNHKLLGNYSDFSLNR